MSPAAQKMVDEYQALLLALQDELGVVVGDEKHQIIRDQLKLILQDTGIESLGVLADKLRQESSNELRASVLQAITTHESGFTGYSEITSLLEEYVLPGIVNETKSDYRIWVVGCGEGQLAYLVAMVVDDFKQHYGMTCSVDIVASDLSEATVKRASEGIYDEDMLDGLSMSYRKTYMIENNGKWEVDQSIRSSVYFKSSELLSSLDSMGHFDLIICPNVLVYFSNHVKTGILESFADLLDPSGMLIVSASEAVRPFCKNFELVNHDAGVFYRQIPL